MKIPIIIDVTDKSPRMIGINNVLVVRVLAKDTRLPYFQFECNRKDLLDAIKEKNEITGSELTNCKLDGYITA